MRLFNIVVMVTEDDLLNDLERIKENDVNWTKNIKENSKHSISTYYEKFGSLETALNKVDASLRDYRRTRKELIERMKALEEHQRVVTSGALNFDVTRWFGDIEEARRLADLEIVTQEDIKEAACQEIIENFSNGFHRLVDINEHFNEVLGYEFVGGGYCCMSLEDFAEYFNENTEYSMRSSGQGGNHSGIYLDKNITKSEEAYMEEMRKRYDSLVEETDEFDDPGLFQEFVHLMGRGISPRGAFSSLLYFNYPNRVSQADLADDIGVTEVTIRNNMEAVEEIVG